MRKIPITALTPGMVTAEDILSYDHKPVVPKGIILTENIISRLEGYSIYYAHIEDNLVVDMSMPMTNAAIDKKQDASITALYSNTALESDMHDNPDMSRQYFFASFCSVR